MPHLTVRNGPSGSVVLYYKDWQPGTVRHGWPLSADAWEDQMIFPPLRGYRCIAHDRRSHGCSGQPWTGNDMDTYVDGLVELVEQLDLSDTTRAWRPHERIQLE